MITIKVKKLSSFLDKSRGLIGYNKIEPVLLSTRFGIHTFGVKYPIDVLILDNNRKVKKIVRNLKPLRIAIWNPSYNTVIELPAGYIKKHNINLGSAIDIIAR